MHDFQPGAFTGRYSCTRCTITADVLNANDYDCKGETK